MERKKEPRHARQHRGDQEPPRPSVEPLRGEQAKQDDQASEDSDKTDERMNYCINVQYHELPITPVSTRNVTYRCNYSTITIKRRPGIRISFVPSSVYPATQPPSTTSDVPVVNFEIGRAHV